MDSPPSWRVTPRAFQTKSRNFLERWELVNLHVRLVIDISGASGAIYGVRALQVLRESSVETHLVLTAARKTIRLETDHRIGEVEKLASESHKIGDITSSSQWFLPHRWNGESHAA